MKRLFAAVMVIVCMVGFTCFGGAEGTDLISRIRDAGEISWASADYIVLDGQMIRASDGKVLFDKVGNIVSTGGYAWIDTAGGEEICIMDKNGGTRTLKPSPDDGALYCANGKCGLFWGATGNYESFVYDPASDKFVLPPAENREILEVYQDSKGQAYILTKSESEERDYTYGIYKADGKQILKEGKYWEVLNCNNGHITNEYLAASDRNYTAVILSPYTGKAIGKYPGFGWVPYDSNHMIYRDNTALIGPLTEEEGEYSGNEGYGTKIIGLDGSILKVLPKECTILSRLEGESIYYIDSPEGNGGHYNVVTDRTYWYGEADSTGSGSITCEETGETFKEVKTDKEGGTPEYQSLKTGKTYSQDDIYTSGTPIAKRYEKYRPVQERIYWPEYTEDGLKITAPDGSMLGNQYWKGIAWDRERWLGEGIGGYDVFADMPVCAVADENDLYAVFNQKGEMVLPAEYEEVNLIGSFSDDPKANGYCLAAKKNGQWHLFTIQGKALYTEPVSETTEESKDAAGTAAGQEGDVHVLSEQFAGKEAGLHKLGGREKVTVFAGPGKEYPVVRKISPNEKNTTIAYFIEDDMVFVHYIHRSVDLYGYMKTGTFAAGELEGVPEIDELTYIQKKTGKEVVPLTGPGEGYEKWNGPAIPAGSDIRCYFTENGYCYCEYDFSTGPARIWVSETV